MPNALHVAPASAGELLEEARGLALQEPWRRQARIVVDQAPPELGIACDRESVIRALLQLVRNAAEAGATTIRLAGDAPADGQVRLRVRDDGPGIAPERMQRLFQMFSSGNRQAGRLGLGLWTVQRICAAQGGQAQARNLSPTGAEFALLLPRAADGE